MPKTKPSLNLNLLKPQNNPEKVPVKLLQWLLYSGRYIFVLVEAIVLIAFAARFKLDADLATTKEAIEEQIPYIESLKPYEIVIRQTQFKLSNINNIKSNSLDGTLILTRIADQTPPGVKIISINLKKNAGNASIHITGQTQFNKDLSSFIISLKSDKIFSNVNIASIGLEEGVIKFTVDTSAQLANFAGKNL